MLGQNVLDDIVGCIVKVAEPEKIILFGICRAMNCHSTVDLLIVKPALWEGWTVYGGA